MLLDLGEEKSPGTRKQIEHLHEFEYLYVDTTDPQKRVWLHIPSRSQQPVHCSYVRTVKLEESESYAYQRETGNAQGFPHNLTS
jgi:hypothetical protein